MATYTWDQIERALKAANIKKQGAAYDIEMHSLFFRDKLREIKKADMKKAKASKS